MEAILVGILALFTFLSRRINLLSVPIFTDEAIYIRWAQIGLADPAHRYISLTDGKQPLFTWFMYPFLLLFKDPLFAGRFVSVLASVGLAIGIYITARKLFGKKTAIFASLLYIISPFFMVYDRLALMDSLLAMFGIWSLYLQILLIQSPRLDTAMILGMTVGAGMITKSSAQFFLFLLPVSLLLGNFHKKKRLKQIVKWIGAASVCFIIAQVMFNSLRLSPAFYIINQKDHVFILTLKEFFEKPFGIFFSNMDGLVQMLVGYLSIPMIGLIVVSIIFALTRKDKKILFLLFWFLIPFLALAAFGKIVFPRFMLFMVLPLFIIAADLLSRLSYFAWKKMRILLLIIPLILFYPAYQSYLLITHPVEADIPQVDRNQLFDDWPSGYGVREVIAYLSREAEDKKIIVGTEGTFGLNPAVYEIYLGLNKNVEIHSYWPVGEVPIELIEKAKEYPTYLIFKEKQDIPVNWPLNLIAKYKRGKGSTYLLFYRVIPSQ